MSRPIRDRRSRPYRRQNIIRPPASTDAICPQARPKLIIRRNRCEPEGTGVAGADADKQRPLKPR